MWNRALCVLFVPGLGGWVSGWVGGLGVGVVVVVVGGGARGTRCALDVMRGTSAVRVHCDGPTYLLLTAAKDTAARCKRAARAAIDGI
jgi:hypothetical protein